MKTYKGLGHILIQDLKQTMVNRIHNGYGANGCQPGDWEAPCSV